MFIYDTHVHSSECSGCAKNNVRELVHAYKEAGFSGFVLTNHFYHGNTAISRDIAWEDFANAYYNAFLEAKAEGDKYGVDVIFGLEEYVGRGKEYLLYNIDLNFMLNNPDLRTIDGKELAARVHAAGGFVSHAHPFRFRDYMKAYYDPEFSDCDAIEIYNANNTPEENARAAEAARQLGKYFTCGSDSHLIGNVAERRTGMVFPRRVTNGEELVAALLDRQTTPYINGETYYEGFGK